MDATHIGEELLTASTALAGLILVFIGNAVSGYDSYSATEQHAVRRKYRRRGWIGFAGFCAALASVGFALLQNWANESCIVYASVLFFVLALAIVCIAALEQVRGIA